MEKVAFSYVRMFKEFWIVNSSDRRKKKKSHVRLTWHLITDRAARLSNWPIYWTNALPNPELLLKPLSWYYATHIVAFSCVFPQIRSHLQWNKWAPLKRVLRFVLYEIIHALLFVLLLNSRRALASEHQTNQTTATILNVKHSKNENSLLLIVVKIIANYKHHNICLTVK